MTAETGVPAVDEQQQNKAKRAVFPLFSRPIQRQRWEDEQIHPIVNWGDLFFDLFYVAAAYNLGVVVVESPTAEGLLYFIAMFFAIMYMWLDKMFYDSRYFTHDDFWHRVFEVAVLVVVATAVLHIRPVPFMSTPSKYNDMFAFSLACVLYNVLTIVRYIEVYFWVDGEQPCCRKSARRDIFAKLFPTGFYVAAMVVSAVEYYGQPSDYGSDSSYAKNTTSYDDGHRSLAEATSASSSYSSTNVPIWLILGASLASATWMTIQITLLYPKGGRHKEITVPMNIDFCIHRYGEWTMLMLGESVLSLLIVEVSGGSRYYGTFYTGILSVILLQYMHFRSQPSHPDEHAMRRKKEAGLAFSYLMMIYSAALILLGASYKMFLYEYVYLEDGAHRTLFGGWGHHYQMDAARPMLFHVGRFLAGGGGALQFDTEDRQQRMANFFCGSLATVWFCSDAMLIVHRGLKDNVGRCRCKHSHKARKIGVALVMIRLGLIVFMATLRGYVTDPLLLAVIGLCCIIVQLILRVISAVVFPDDRVHSEVDEHGNPILVEDGVEERKWPNTTQAQAIPGKHEDPEDITGTSNTGSDEQGASSDE